MTSARARPGRLSPVFAIGFQTGILVLGALGVWLLGTGELAGSMSLWAATFWGVLGSIATLFFIGLLFFAPGKTGRVFARHVTQLRAFSSDYSLGVLIALAILAGVGEELLFRGALQNWLAQTMPGWAAVVCAALVFGIVHYLSFLYFLIASVLGLVLGGIYWLTESLWLVMVWHGTYDMVALYCLKRLPQRAKNPTDSE